MAQRVKLHTNEEGIQISGTLIKSQRSEGSERGSQSLAN